MGEYKAIPTNCIRAVLAEIIVNKRKGVVVEEVARKWGVDVERLYKRISRILENEDLTSRYVGKGHDFNEDGTIKEHNQCDPIDVFE